MIQPSPIVLTRQQRRVLALAATGMTPYEIAIHLHVSWETVRWHLKNCHLQLGVHDRRAAIQRALELGLIHRTEAAPEAAVPMHPTEEAS